MTTIEDKIKLFSKIVYDKIQSEKQKEFDAFEAEKDKTLSDEKQKFENKNKIILEETEKKALLKGNELIAQEKAESQQRILKLKQKFISDSMMDLRKKVTKYTDDPAYKDFLLDSLSSTLTKLDKGGYDLYLTAKDICNYRNDIDIKVKEFTGIEISLKEAEYDIIGGVLLISQNGKVRIDDTLNSKVEDAREYIGVRIAQKIG